MLVCFRLEFSKERVGADIEVDTCVTPLEICPQNRCAFAGICFSHLEVFHCSTSPQSHFASLAGITDPIHFTERSDKPAFAIHFDRFDRGFAKLPCSASLYRHQVHSLGRDTEPNCSR